ncbi:MAG: YsnF/AvaK domain-containing protein [Pseudomonadota bacterium]|nr:YsnF/AvaK domain-containing protein [Pseudomonadota bacterium]
MPDETIVAVYDTAAHADAAVRDLEAANVPSSAISRHAGSATTTTTGSTAPVREKGFWSSLFGGEPDHDESVYDRSLDSGSSVVTVKVPTEHVERVTAILEQHSPVDMDERAASYGTNATTTTTTTTAATPAVGMTPVKGTAMAAGGEEVIALSEEQLQVGKRLVNHGTTRIRRFVVETPVEEAVTLHSEHVSVERRPVAAGTKVTDADFTDRTIEVTETDEEAVVAKTAHVKEEVVVNKTAADRVETVRDTVRHEDVEITKDGAATATSTSATTGPVSPTTPSRI